MIGRIHGTLITISAPKLLIDCHGVGYEVDVPMSTLYQLPAVGQLITLLTHFHVREDQQQLFGFATEAERDAFRSLIKISGVGARTALAVFAVAARASLLEAATT
ncbi:MAG: Holliday junction branch migration protein RuvA, partial [Burkholderiaceae bacterium]|nr:Holliday junction branch migration protein RuvA [Burkholderiaceae bacterium]